MKINKILCGVTHSEASRAAAVEAAGLSKENNAELVFLYVADASFLKGISVSTKPSTAEVGLEKIGAGIIERACALAKEIGVDATGVVKVGSVLDKIKETLEEQDADMLVIGHEDLSYFEKLVFKRPVEAHVAKFEKDLGIKVRVAGRE